MAHPDSLERDLSRAWIASQPLFAAMEHIAGFTLPDHLRSRFETIHLYTRQEPAGEAVSHLRPTERRPRDWLHEFRSSLLGHVQEGLGATYYHLRRIEEIEGQLSEFTRKLDLPRNLSSSTSVGGGNTRALNYEYQAYLFAIRRTLEYFALFTSAYFKTDCHRIRGLRGAIEQRKPSRKRDAVLKVLDEALPGMDDVVPLNRSENRSPRDRAAHWEAVQAGTINVSWTPQSVSVSLVGGAEGLPSPIPIADSDAVLEPTLAPLLRTQVARVEALLFSLLAALDIPFAPDDSNSLA
jgi:hypothetical protein